MYIKKTIFAQLQEYLPIHKFKVCVKRYEAIIRYNCLPARINIFVCFLLN